MTKFQTYFIKAKHICINVCILVSKCSKVRYTYKPFIIPTTNMLNSNIIVNLKYAMLLLTKFVLIDLEYVSVEFIVMTDIKITNIHTLPNHANKSKLAGSSPVIYAVVISHIYTAECVAYVGFTLP